MSLIISTLKAGVLTLCLNRPQRANAFNREMVGELRRALDAAAQDFGVRCIVLTGAGENFSAGQDISEMRLGHETSYQIHLNETYNPLVMQIRELGKPVIAAVNGACAGAAFGVALACDLRIAKSSAYFVVGFGGIALAPDSGVSLLLPLYIGLARALEYYYSNLPIGAQQALQWGMVNQVAGADFDDTVLRTAQKIALGPASAFSLAKRAFNHAMLPGLADVLEFEGTLQEEAGKTAEHREGVSAFLEKRRPDYVPGEL